MVAKFDHQLIEDRNPVIYKAAIGGARFFPFGEMEKQPLYKSLSPPQSGWIETMNSAHLNGHASEEAMKIGGTNKISEELRSRPMFQGISQQNMA